MKILVVGGAGYIGSHVCKALIKAGFETVVFDNLSSGLRDNLLPQSGFIHGDILDAGALAKVCLSGAFDGIIHLAAKKAAGESMTDPEKYSVFNIMGTLNLIHAAVEGGIDTLVFSSSAAVYGEPKYLPVDEEHPRQPENYYGFTKLEIESFLSWYDRLKGLKYAALRYFNAAGYDVDGQLKGLEQNPANLLPVIMETAAGIRPKLTIFGNDYDTPDGTCIRDYIHVSDLAEAHVLALQHVLQKRESLVVNLGSETGVSVMEMVKKAVEVTGRDFPFEIAARRLGDPAKLIASSTLAKKILGWQPRHSDVDTLIRTTWKAYQAHLQGVAR